MKIIQGSTWPVCSTDSGSCADPRRHQAKNQLKKERCL